MVLAMASLELPNKKKGAFDLRAGNRVSGPFNASVGTPLLFFRARPWQKERSVPNDRRGILVVARAAGSVSAAGPDPVQTERSDILKKNLAHVG